MTFGSQPALVGAVFTERSSAAAAAADQRNSGFDDDELATAGWLGEVLIVMAEKDRPGIVREKLERHGGRRVEPVHP